jgi:DNA (cytosine-5)-methyltransferase 1
MGKKNFPKNFTFIDLFAGIGGFRIALESFGGKCVFCSDWDKQAQIVYEANFGEKPAGDITKIDAKKIPPHNILCAGFPCQAFSISGKQKGFEDTRGTLFFDIARIAKHRQPEVLFLENVKNFAKHDKGRTLQIVLNVLDEIGYNSFYKVLNASHYGIPQARERIYFVCFRKDLGIDDFDFPKPTFKPVRLKDILQPNSKAEKYIIDRKDIKINGNPSKLKKDIFGNYPLSPIQIGTINKGGQGERIYSIEGHSIALTAYGGGAASKTGAYLVNGVVRKLTPYECSQLMGFPKSFKIPVTDSQAYKLFGNSVVVPVLKKIFKEVIKKLS